MRLLHLSILVFLSELGVADVTQGSKSAVVVEEVAKPTKAPVWLPLLPGPSLPTATSCYPLYDDDEFVLEKNVEMKKMMGRWFEGLATPHSVKEKCIVHEYKRLIRNPHTNIISFDAWTTYRYGSPGTVKRVFGIASSTNNTDAMLQMQNEEDAEGRAFWIYKVGPESRDSFGQPQYEYAIVSNCIKYPVLVLVRNYGTFVEKYKKEILSWLEELDFKVGENWTLVQPAYASCYYADSITQSV